MSRLRNDTGNDYRNLLLNLWYQGNADSGRVAIHANIRGYLKIEFTHHPMVKASTPPWTHQSEGEGSDVAALFEEAWSVGKFKYSVGPLLPGQDVSLKELSMAAGKSPPRIKATYIEVPEALAGVSRELEKIYARVKGR